MADPDFSQFKLVAKGNQFEDFSLGQVFQHHWGRTLNAGDNSLFTTATLAHCPLYFNAEYARAHGHPDVVINPMLVACTVVGISVEDLSEAGGPFLGINDLEFHRAVYPGDTLTACSTVVAKRESASRGNFGIVTWRTEACNQRGEPVLSYHRTNLVAKRRGKRRMTGYMTDERLMIQRTAREFAMNEVFPVANRLDPEQGDIPIDLRDKMAQQGYFGVLIPEQYGGLGMGAFEYVLITEELARAWMSVASIIARGNGLGGGFTAAQRAEYLPKMARGEFLGAAAFSEPDAGSDLANVSCRATRDGDGWVLNGTKTWCTFADGADFILVLARTRQPSDPRRRHEGISQFLVLKERGTFPPGLTGAPIRKIGYFGWKTWELHFDNFRLPADALLGREREDRGEGKGFYGAVSGLEVARVHTAARAIGLARGGLEDALVYAQRRVQFGRPIGEFQAIRFKLAEMATEIEAARQLTYFVANEADSHRRCDKEASMAKLFASEMAERVTSQALQIHGGYGYTKDLPLERYWRDARLTKIFEGTSEIQMRIISDRLLPKGGRE